MINKKLTRAQKMAATYPDVLIKAGVLKVNAKQVSPIPAIPQKGGGTNWWLQCLGWPHSSD